MSRATSDSSTQPLETLFTNETLEFCFIGGKGGVGKTTCSSSLAIKMAERHQEKKILLISTDPAHNLSDAFGQVFDGKPQKIKGLKNLYAMESDPAEALQKATEDIASTQEEKEDGADGSGAESQTSEMVEEFRQWIQSVPGIDEAMALSNVLKFLESGEFQMILFDTAPTGHTLRLLQLPVVLKLGLQKLNSWKAKLAGVFGSLMSVVYEGSSAQKQAESIKKLEAKLQEYQRSVTKISEIFRDQEKTQFVCICIAEHLSVFETHRLTAELAEAKINCQHILVNQLVPRAIAGVEESVVDKVLQAGQAPKALGATMKQAIQLCGARANIQGIYLQKLSDAVAGKQAVTLLPLLAREVRGTKALKEFAQYLTTPDSRLVDNGVADLSVLAAETAEYEAEVSAKFMSRISMVDEKEGKGEEKEVEDIGEETKTLPGGFEVGNAVILHGLQGAKQHNGKKGTIVSFVEDKGRFQVRLMEGKRNLLLKAVNLKLDPEREGDIPASTATRPGGGSEAKITPAMMSVVQGMMMKPGGLPAMLKHPLVSQLKKRDPKMKECFDNLEQNGMMAGLAYLSDAYVMGKLAELAETMQAASEKSQGETETQTQSSEGQPKRKKQRKKKKH